MSLTKRGDFTTIRIKFFERYNEKTESGYGPKLAGKYFFDSKEIFAC